MRLQRNLGLIYTAALLRSLGVGLTGVLLGVYLARAGFSATRIGAVIAVGLAGVAAATLVVTLRAERLGRRRLLVFLSLLAAAGGFGLALTNSWLGVLGLAFFGMLNGMGKDRGAAYSLEQALIAETTAARQRTWAMAWFSLVLDAGLALGALAAAAPLLFQRWLGVGVLASYHLAFAAYGALNLLSGAAYLFLTAEVEAVPDSRTAASDTRATVPAVSPETKRTVGKLAGLFAIDGFGGGFLTAALIAYWFFQRFGVAEGSLATLFFVVRVLNAGSQLAAAGLARRFGLVNTMVFTHIPSSLFLMAVPLAPSFPWAVGLFLARECLVQMDVPTRQSYVVAVVAPTERAFASGATNLTRNLSWAAAPSLAGFCMEHLALGSPLVLGGGIKIFYDVLLYVAFRRLKPPEERMAE